jgi:hypothetical protein
MFCRTLTALATILPLALASRLQADDEFEESPISYSSSAPDNCISELQWKIDSGEVVLNYDETFGYLPDVLSSLGVPIESQMLVFSKTSLQLRRISPGTPRAIYFNDDAYIGFCQDGDVLEVSASDSKLGTVFYSMRQEQQDRPQFRRHTDACLVCHSSSRTEGVPGHLVRSVFVDTEGTPILSSGSRVVDHTTPFEHRWGGWYVTGTHGSQRHLGNLTIDGRDVPEPLDNSAGQNVSKLAERFDVTKYLSPHSDIVALMVLEHQSLTHNRLTKANFATRQALAHEKMLNEMLENPPNKRLDSTTRRIQNAGNALVEALLFVDEAKLTEPIAGTSNFTRVFAAAGPHDEAVRSLRDLDLKIRLFRYPCSHLIYSDAFKGLPAEVKSFVWQRLWEVLSGADQSDRFAHLSAADRQAILEILRETVRDLPEAWTAGIKTEPRGRTESK